MNSIANAVTGARVRDLCLISGVGLNCLPFWKCVVRCWDAFREQTRRHCSKMPKYSMLRLILKEMRPRQWPKNGFVFLPLLFTVSQYWRPFSPTMWVFLGLTLGAFVVFCFASGFVYFVNDLVDVEKDRAHPRKRTRPIASGALPQDLAKGVSVLLLGITLAGAVALDIVSQQFPYPAGAPIFPFPFAFTAVTVVY